MLFYFVVSRMVTRFLCLLLFIQASYSFIEKREIACHSSGACGRAHLTCDAGQRIAVLDVRHGHHVNSPTFDQCPSSIQNCSSIGSTVPDACCKNSSVDCLEDYTTLAHLLNAHMNCSGKMASTGSLSEGNSTTCDLDLPAESQPAIGRCSVIGYLNMSSYSAVDYACIDDVDIVPLCQASQKVGTLLYTWWSPAASSSFGSGMTSCQCRVTSSLSSIASVFVRALDVRLPRGDVTTGACSSVTVRGTDRTLLSTSCSQDTVILFKNSTSQQNAIMETTPIDVIVSFDGRRLPDFIWIGFTGLNNEQLNLTCLNAGENLTTLGNTSPNYSDSDASVAVAIAVGVSVAVILVVVVVVFVCFYNTVKKRKGAMSTGPQPRSRSKLSWWEQAREEDRLARLSQLGPATRVIIDKGKHMRYGKRPTTKRVYRTSDKNAPIFIVPGSAFPKRAHEGEDVFQNRAYEGEDDSAGASHFPDHIPEPIPNSPGLFPTSHGNTFPRRYHGDQYTSVNNPSDNQGDSREHRRRSSASSRSDDTNSSAKDHSVQSEDDDSRQDDSSSHSRHHQNSPPGKRSVPHSRPFSAHDYQDPRVKQGISVDIHQPFAHPDSTYYNNNPQQRPLSDSLYYNNPQRPQLDSVYYSNQQPRPQPDYDNPTKPQFYSMRVPPPRTMLPIPPAMYHSGGPVLFLAQDPEPDPRKRYDIPPLTIKELTD